LSKGFSILRDSKIILQAENVAKKFWQDEELVKRLKDFGRLKNTR
jgi:hypothetical protein